jgi:alkylation response protein AidB-like acyl-CoA dehydrogenase
VAKARIEIEAMRLMVLRAAKAMDEPPHPESARTAKSAPNNSPLAIRVSEWPELDA